MRLITNALTGEVGVRSSRYIELASGLNCRDSSGQWQRSRPEFVRAPGAFVADQGAHKVVLNRRLVAGAVDFLAIEGVRVRNHPIGIGYFDPKTGKSALLAEVQPVAGQVISSNIVAFPNAFSSVSASNGISASVRYVNWTGSFHQDVILHTAPPPPESMGLSELTRLEIYTELDPETPLPQITRRVIREETNPDLRDSMAEPDVIDETLSFGAQTMMGPGRAYFLGSQSDLKTPANDLPSVPVYKRLVFVSGRLLLIESIDYNQIKLWLSSLPQGAAPAPSGTTSSLRSGAFSPSSNRIFPVSSRLVPSDPGEAPSGSSFSAMGLASAPGLSANPAPGLVIDYIISGSANNFTFQSDTTYLVNGPFNASGTTTLEAAVIKYPKIPNAYVAINGTLVCKTSQYFPAVFTASEDSSVGERISFDPVVPTGFYANPALQFPYGNTEVKHARFAFAKEALHYWGPSYNHVVRHVQFVHCEKGIVAGGFYYCVNTFYLRNALMHDVGTAFSGQFFIGAMEHVTINDCDNLSSPTAYYGDLSFKNSILANVTALGNAYPSGSYLGFYNSPQFGSPRFTSAYSPFKTVGSGMNYLLPDSVFRQKGTTAIDATLLDDLKKRTTQAPVFLTHPFTITEDTIWSPQAPRYASGAPDLGAFYDPLDYLICYVRLNEAKLTVAAGTAVGVIQTVVNGPFGFPVVSILGLALGTDSYLVSSGLATNLNRFVGAESVQEQYNQSAAYPDNEVGGFRTLIIAPENEPFPAASLRFTDFAALSGYNFHLAAGLDQWSCFSGSGNIASLEFRDCQFRGGTLNFNQWPEPVAGSIVLVNDLFERVGNTSHEAWLHPAVETTVEAYNNTFKGGLFVLWPTLDNIWTFKDNLFDKTGLDQAQDVQIVNDYNGYWLDPGQPRLSPNGPNDKLLSASPPYQTGTLGAYYLYPSTSLYNGGSRAASDASLYHDTTRISQQKEGNTSPPTVDIGFHYVALVSAKPAETDTDGLPDYYEDTNGNGIQDGAETGFLVADSDSDGVNDGNEDTDLDQVIDKMEYELGTDPQWAHEDYDHDGNLNPLEQYLGTNPLLSDSPISIVGWTYGATLPPGEVQIQVQLNPVYQTTSLGLTADGEDIPGVPVLQPPFNNPVTFTVNTARLRNGAHLFRPCALIDNPSDPRGTLVSDTLGPELMLLVWNEISFAGRTHPTGAWEELFPWEDDFSTVFQINAVLAHYPANYMIEIFNSSDQRIFHTQDNQYSAAGLIDYEWNLLQDNGQYYSGAEGDYIYAKLTSFYEGQAASQTSPQISQAQIGSDLGRSRPIAPAPANNASKLLTASASSSGPVVTPRSKYFCVSSYPDQGTWIHAVQRLDSDESLPPIFDALAYGWDYVAQMNGNYALPLPSTGKRAMFHAFQIRYGSTPLEEILKHTADWNTMREIIPDPKARNIWLFGHGDGNIIGGDYDSSLIGGAISDRRGNSKITATEVSDLLGFGNWFSANHYYRFAFLDACSTASRGFWRSAFGVPKVTISSQPDFDKYYKDTSGNFRRRPSAFCGWRIDKPLGRISVPREGLKKYLEVFRDSWLQAPPLQLFSLRAAHEEANKQANQIDPLDPKMPSWGAGLSISGYTELLFEQYNRQSLP